MRQHPGSNNCVEGAYGIARFDRREPVESDEHARSTCGGARAAPAACAALCGAGRPPRGGRRRSFVGGDRLLVANGRCWRRRGSAPRAGAGVRWRRRATAQQRATNTTLAATRRHPCPRMVAADCAWFRSRPENRSWRLAALNDQQKMPRVNPLAPNPRARARARRWRRELGGGVRQHPGSNNCVEGAPALTRSRRILARAREGAALAARARGWCATAPRFKQLR